MRLLNIILSASLMLCLSTSLWAQCTATFQYTSSGNTFTFTPVPNTNINYYWSIDDYNNNSTSTYQTTGSVSHTFSGAPNLGYHYVCMTAFDSISGCQYTFCDSVFHSGNSNPCNNANVGFQYYTNPNGTHFTSYVSGFFPPTTNYYWTFDNAGNSYQQNPTVSLATGVYIVCLTVSDSFCTQTFCDSVVINNGSNPCANFGSSYFTYNQGPGGAVNFNLFSQGPQYPLNATWDFGDGSAPVSNAFNPSHTYNSNGTYIVCVTTDSANCTHTYCDSIVVNNNGSNPCSGTVFQYTNSGNTFTFNPVPNNNINYYWNVDDYNNNTTSTYQTTGSVSHTFSGAPNLGYHYVCLTAFDSITGCQETFCDSVFHGGNTNPCSNANVGFQYYTNPNGTHFTSSVSGFFPPSVNYYWNFDNGTTSYQQNPTVSLATGWYIVCLTVTDSFCTETFCDSVYVNNPNGNPCTGANVGFQYTTTPNGAIAFNSYVSGFQSWATYTWDFGNGMNPNYQQNPTVQLPSGFYLVCLTVDDSICTQTFCDSVWVGNNNPGPCTQNEVILQLDLDNYGYETTWDVRDQQTGALLASGGGSYPNNTTVTERLCLPTGCYILNVYDSYGDGMCCLYGNGGYSMIDATTGVVLASGGSFTYTDSRVVCVGGAQNPCSGFFGNLTSTVNGNNVQFNVSHNGSANASYYWNYGDGTSGYASATPNHTYAGSPNGGFYNPCVTVLDSFGCTTTFCDSVYIAPAPCNQNSLTLEILLDNFPQETTWDVVDASGAVVASGGNYSYSQRGTTVYEQLCLATACYTLNIYDSFGDGICCAYGQGYYRLVTANGNVLASGAAFNQVDQTNFCVGGASSPCLNFGPNSFAYNVGQNGAVSFNLNVGGNQYPLNATWNFGDGTTSSAFNPTHTYTSNGTYVVCVTTDSANCTHTYCDTIVVGTINNNPGGPCQGLSVDINIYQDSTNPFLLWMQPVVNNASPNTSYAFGWTFGDGTGSFSGYPSHTYNSFGSYIVCLFAIDSINGCAANICDTITIDSSGNFSRNVNYKEVKSGFMVNTLPAQINVNTNIDPVAAADAWSLRLFPNPTAADLTLELNAAEAVDGVIRVLDVTGKTVYTRAVEQPEGLTQWTLPTSELPAGVYLVELTNSATQKTLKFIKE